MWKLLTIVYGVLLGGVLSHPFYVCSSNQDDSIVHYYSETKPLTLTSSINKISSNQQCIEACQPCQYGVGFQMWCNPTVKQQEKYGLYPYEEEYHHLYQDAKISYRRIK